MDLNKKIGILGGGQLGKMLCEAASPMNLDLHFLDRSKDFPAGHVAKHFHLGDFTDYEDVVAFGQDKDVVSIEIEKVSLEGLVSLEEDGKVVVPSSQVLRTIRDKGLQKQFYASNNYNTSSFKLYEDKRAIWTAILNEELSYPFVQKSRRDGYDGQGVAVIKTEDDLNKLMDVASVVEDLVDIDKELAITVARTPSGQMTTFPVVEMEFDPEANLVNWLFCPAVIDDEVNQKVQKLAIKLAEDFELTGLLAIELFLAKDGSILINEVAPRPHNSGHHTIEGCNYSQYDIHLRCLLDLPLPKIKLTKPAGMMNLLGDDGFEGKPKIEGLQTFFNTEDSFLHWYGKPDTRPNRKMGHITVLGDDLNEVKHKLSILSKEIKIQS